MAITTADADQSDTTVTDSTKQLAVYDVILTVSQAHHANCAYTEENTRSLARKQLTLPLTSNQSPGAASPEIDGTNGQLTADSKADDQEVRRYNI